MAEFPAVLIVEDDQGIQEILKDLLEDERFAVTCAGNGQSAMEQLASSADLPAVILLDMMMPIMNGYQFREAQLKDGRLAGIGVVVMSAGPIDKTLPCMSGIKSYLKKPLDADLLVQVVRSAL